MDPRRGLGILAVLAGGAVLLGVFRPAPAADASSGTAAADESPSAACRECHPQAYAEWESSWHARAWTDPLVQETSDGFANDECLPCHLPEPVLVTGLDQRVAARTDRHAEGVDCLACHALGGADAGRVAGTVDRPDVACRAKKVADLSGVPLCGSCHDQHQTVLQWMLSRHAMEGTGCIECHMPYRDGDPARGRDHTMHGGHSLAVLRAAVDLRARREGGGVVVEVENVGAGHDFPTDERLRAADVFWRPRGTPAWRFLYRFRSPYRYETDVVETVLPAHASVRIPLDDPDAAGPLEVALFYKLTPYWSDPQRPDPEREAREVVRVEVP